MKYSITYKLGFVKLMYLIILWFIIFSFKANAGEKKPNTFSENGTEKLSLNGWWKFSIDSTLGQDQVWQKPNFKSKNWSTMMVPGNWDTENEYATFVGSGYYRKEFKVPSDWDGSVIRLVFEAVYHTSEVWINGQYLGKHEGGYTPFEFNVSKFIKPGKTNTIALTANNKYQRGAWWNWGGISREVNLVRNTDQQIVSQQITSEPDLINGGARVSVVLKIRNYSDQNFSGRLNVFIESFSKLLALHVKTEVKVNVAAKGEKIEHITFMLEAHQVKLWDFEHPNLYQLKTDLEATDRKTLHKIDTRFGIRKIETKGTKVLLNGKEIHLNGFNRVADHWAYGQTEPDKLVKFDIDAMKTMGCNFTRIMHVPQATNLLDYCDEVGMLLIEEIPVWGKGDPQLQPHNPLTKQWLTEMITRDYNHPCIVGWSVANEIADGDLEGRKMSPRIYGYVETMIAHVKALDSTRLKTYASFTVGTAKEKGIDPADVCDIVCFNSYGEAASIAKRCHELWPDKPIFVTEIGKDPLGENLEKSGLEESLKTAIKNLKELDYVVGSSLWTYNDYRSNYNNTPISQNRTWGVYNVWRQPKKGAQEIQQLYSSQSQPLESMVPAQEMLTTMAPTIWAVVPLKRSCMVGFSVIDKKDNYEIEYRMGKGNPKIVKINGLRGAAKVYDLKPGDYSFKIRRISEENAGEWSAAYPATVLD